MGIFGSIGKAIGGAVGKVPGMGALGGAVSKVPGVGKVGGSIGLPGIKPAAPAAPAGALGAAGAAGGLLGKALGKAAPIAATPNLATKPIASADAGALGSDTDLAKPAVMARKTFSKGGFRGGRR